MLKKKIYMCWSPCSSPSLALASYSSDSGVTRSNSLIWTSRPLHVEIIFQAQMVANLQWFDSPVFYLMIGWKWSQEVETLLGLLNLIFPQLALCGPILFLDAGQQQQVQLPVNPKVMREGSLPLCCWARVHWSSGIFSESSTYDNFNVRAVHQDITLCQVEESLYLNPLHLAFSTWIILNMHLPLVDFCYYYSLIWIGKKMWGILHYRVLVSLKNKELLSFLTTGMNLVGIMLIEISQTQKHKCYIQVQSFMWNLKKSLTLKNRA